MYYRQSLGGAT